MQLKQKTYKPGRWVALGVALGTFAGLLFGKLALGMIFGLFLGIAIDSSKRRSASAAEDQPADVEKHV